MNRGTEVPLFVTRLKKFDFLDGTKRKGVSIGYTLLVGFASLPSYGNKVRGLLVTLPSLLIAPVTALVVPDGPFHSY